LWAREADLVADMRASRENRRFLPGFPLPDALMVTAVLEEALEQAELVVIATPTAGLRAALQALFRRPGAALPPLVWVCKGFEAETGLLPHAVLAEVQQETGGECSWHGALSGPSFAQEVAAGLPAAVTLASPDLAFARRMAHSLHGESLRVYASNDLAGVEVGGALKNIMAIASGVCDGLSLGANARAALMTRGLAEIARLGQALGGRKETFMGLAGVGDLILTCTGDLSRNRRVGLELAAGKPLAAILAELGHVAEGVPVALAVRRIAVRRQIEMPITEAVAALLEGQVSPHDAVAALLARNPAEE
jgi:glycerol-3-phosphate dehydrogenase (NAD(P)+)